MRRLLSTRRFFLSGKNKISILHPCSSISAIICTGLYKLAVLGVIYLVVKLVLQQNPPAQNIKSATAARIFCIITTHADRQEHTATYIKRTWGKHCDEFLVVSNDAHEELEPAVFNHISDKWLEMRAHLEYVYTYHLKEADWFLYANDDNYVVVENLRHMLQPFNPKELIYFGCKLKSPTNQIYMYARSGIVFSSTALKQFVRKAMPNESICSSQPQGSAATEELGRCLSNVNVLDGDSRDHLGYHRFVPFDLKLHLTGELNSSLEEHKSFMDRSYYQLTNLNLPVSLTLVCTKIDYLPYMYNHYYLTYKAKHFGLPPAIPQQHVQRSAL